MEGFAVHHLVAYAWDPYRLADELRTSHGHHSLHMASDVRKCPSWRTAVPPSGAYTILVRGSKFLSEYVPPRSRLLKTGDMITGEILRKTCVASVDKLKHLMTRRSNDNPSRPSASSLPMSSSRPLFLCTPSATPTQVHQVQSARRHPPYNPSPFQGQHPHPSASRHRRPLQRQLQRPPPLVERCQRRLQRFRPHSCRLGAPRAPRKPWR